MNKHVSGPYEVLPLDGKYYGTVLRIGMHTFSVWAINYEDFKPSSRELARGWEPEDGTDHVEDERTYHTALLLAAAPDLLEALEALPLDESFEDAADFKDNASAFLRAMELARIAIAKVMGGAK